MAKWRITLREVAFYRVEVEAPTYEDAEELAWPGRIPANFLETDDEDVVLVERLVDGTFEEQSWDEYDSYAEDENGVQIEIEEAE